MAIQSDNQQEGSVLLQNLIFINYDNFLVCSVMVNFGSNIIEEVWLSNLIFEFSVDWHCFELNKNIFTLRFMVAPDSRSPNLKNPVHM